MLIHLLLPCVLICIDMEGIIMAHGKCALDIPRNFIIGIIIFKLFSVACLGFLCVKSSSFSTFICQGAGVEVPAIVK